MTAFVVVNPRAGQWPHRPRLARNQAGAGKRLSPDAGGAKARPAARPRSWCAPRCKTAIWTSSRWAATAPSTKRSTAFSSMACRFRPMRCSVLSPPATTAISAAPSASSPAMRRRIARLKQSRIRRLDVGHVACLSPQGEPVSRYFVNVASFGLSGRVACAAQPRRHRQAFGGVFASRPSLALLRLASPAGPADHRHRL